MGGPNSGRKGQKGIYLSILAQNVLLNVAKLTGLTQSMVVEIAIKEYAANHKEELAYYQHLADQRGRITSDN